MYTNQINFLNFASDIIPSFRAAPRLHVRWQTEPSEDGSGLTPLPVERSSTPEILTVSTDSPWMQTFSFDDGGLTSGPHEFAVSVRDPDAPEVESWLYRSGPLQTLPNPAPANPQGFFQIIVPSPSVRTATQLNDAIGGRFAGGATISQDGATITGVIIAANPSNTSTLLLTIMGTHTGPMPPGAPPGMIALGTVSFRYSGELRFDPFTDVFQTNRIFTAIVANPSIAFFPIPGGNPISGVTTSFQAAFLNLLSPLILLLLQNVVEAAVGAEVDREARDNASTSLGIPRKPDGSPGDLPSTITITAQKATIISGEVTFWVTLGSIGSARPATSTTCFIATAIHGADSIEVSTLRAFRDQCLSTSLLGRSIVLLYERLSPPVAALITKSQILRSVARKLVVYPAFWLAKRSLTRRSSRRAGRGSC